MPRILRFVVLSLIVSTLALGAGSRFTAADDDGSLHGPGVVVVRDLPSTNPAAPSLERRIHKPEEHETETPPRNEIPAPNVTDPQIQSAEVTAQVATPATIVASFPAMTNDDNATIIATTLEPPDPQVAVGPQYVVEFVNLIGGIYTRAGDSVQKFALSDFFQVPSGDFSSDPRIMYDALTGRWFASYLSLRDLPGTGSDLGRLHVAVSQASDPTGAWNVYFTSYSQVFPDQPWLGLSNNKVTVSSNMYQITGNDSVCPPYGDGYAGEQTVVYEKADLMAGVVAGTLRSTSLARDCDRYSVHPAQQLSAGDDQFLATFDTSNLSRLTLLKITGTPAAFNVVETQVANLPIATQSDPPLAVVPGPSGNTNLDAGDRRLLDAVWRGGTLWVSASAGCVVSSQFLSCAHLIQVNTGGSATVTQDIMFGGPSGEYWFYPSLTTDDDGNLYVTVTHASPATQPEARLLSRMAGDAVNTLRPSVLIKAGEVDYASTYHRWGDYLGTVPDPTIPGCVWSVGEYTKTAAGPNWGTYIASSTLSGGCQDADGDGIIDQADNCPANANFAQVNTDLVLESAGAAVTGDTLGDACDPDDDNDGFSDAIEGAIGTNPLDNCVAGPGTGGDSWPLDNNADGFVNVADVLAYKGKTPNAVDATHPKRLDINDDNFLNVVDVLGFKGNTPAGCN